MNKSAIQLLVYDFDGVLTDNQVWVNQDGVEAVACNRSDGLWIGKIKDLAIEQIILSAETNPVVQARAKKLGLKAIQGVLNKKEALLQLLDEKKIEASGVAYVGNDVNDLDCLKLVGLAMAPEDSHPEVLKVAHQVLKKRDARGIVWQIHHLLTSAPQVENYGKNLANLNVENLKIIKDVLKESIEVKQSVLANEALLKLVDQMAQVCVTALQDGKKILFAGNGGSFADSMHLAAELVSRLRYDRPALPGIALGTSNSNLTAIGNDYSYEDVFEREIAALGNTGDVFIAISTSGNSPNILKAVKMAKTRKLHVFGLSGKTGGKLVNECNTVCVPATETARIQECHILLGHVLCQIIEATLFPKQ
jgi:D-sedoheptulose 7-phosphate isomerase